MTEYYLRLPEVMRQTSLSRSTLLEMVKADRFPAPRKIGLKAVAWLNSEVQDWISIQPKVGYISGTKSG